MADMGGEQSNGFMGIEINNSVSLSQEFKKADRLIISNFRSIKSAELHFVAHNLMGLHIGDIVLKHIATELVQIIKDNLDVDWAGKEIARAKVRMAVKRLLKKSGYPPDLQEKATQLVLEHSEKLCMGWT